MALTLDNIINVSVELSPTSTIAAGFNIGLIVGASTVISAVTRTKEYANLTEMLSDGFVITDEEYVAAALYFGQSKRPSKVIIGRWDQTGAETAAEAVTACRASNTEWYACMVCGAEKADIIAVAAIIEAADPVAIYFFDTDDADVPAGTAGNVFLTLQASDYSRSIGQYSAQVDSIAAIMGYAMGASSQAANTAYTLDYKSEVGVTPDDLTSAEVTNITDANGNIYVTRGQTYTIFQQGTMANGQRFDEVLGLDMLTQDIQESVMNALTSSPKIPQTDEGVTYLINVVSQACRRARVREFLAPGVWTAPQILNIETGDTLSDGFTVLAESVATQSQSDIDNRIAPTIYVLVKLAGAIENVVININVNR